MRRWRKALTRLQVESSELVHGSTEPDCRDTDETSLRTPRPPLDVSLLDREAASAVAGRFEYDRHAVVYGLAATLGC
jgi:hypothetical protein